ncbi:MAG: glycosyltransferase family 87 protein [Aureliella sp.]
MPQAPSRRDYRWLLPALCAALGWALALGNPNYRWSDARDVPYGADFLQEWVAGDMLLHGQARAIYDREAFAQRQHDSERVGFQWPESQFYPAVYPPPYYCLVAPLAALPYRAAALVWLAMMMAAYPLAVWCAGRRPWSGGDTCGMPAPSDSQTFWCVVLLFPALFMSLVMGQKGTLWLLIAVASWQLWRTERTFAAGCLWALLTVKPTLCCWLPLVMLANRQWRFCSGVALGAACLWGITTLVVPRSLWSDFYSVVLSSGSYQEHAGYRDGWSASMLTLFSAIGLPRGVSLGLWGISAAAILGSLVGLPRDLPVRQRLEHPEFLLRTLVGTALLSPHFYFYDLVWLIYPLAGLFRSSPRRAIVYLAVLWLSMLFVQQSENGWPLVALALLGIFGHASVALMGCSSREATARISLGRESF